MELPRLASCRPRAFEKACVLVASATVSHAFEPERAFRMQELTAEFTTDVAV